MYFSTVVAFSALPFLVGAVPVSLKSSRNDGLISIPLTKRLNHFNDDGSVHLGKLQAGLSHRNSVFERALHAYEINTGQPHPHALKRGDSNERRTFVPASLKAETVNLLWTADISVGTPSKPFSVSLDTTSSDTYLNGQFCQNCTSRNFYDISTSSTGKTLKSDATTDLSFGRVNGDVVTDSLSLAGKEVANQAIFVAKGVITRFSFGTLPSTSSLTPSDGTVGLGLSNLTSALRTNSYFASLVNSGGLSDGQPVMGFVLAGPTPQLIVGGTDTTKFMGQLNFNNVETPIFWEIQMNSMAINGNIVAADKEAIIDMADVFISSNNETIANIYSNIPGSVAIPNSGFWGVPCNQTKVDVIITLGGISYEIPLQIGDSTSIIPIQGPGNPCIGPFATRDDPSPIMHMGTVLMQHFYTEFNIGNMTVGLAQINA